MNQKLFPKFYKAIFLAVAISSINFILTVVCPVSGGDSSLFYRISETYAVTNSEESVFILLDQDNKVLLAQVQAYIGAGEGRVMHIFPHRAVIAKIPAARRQQLAGWPGVAMVRTQPVELSTVDIFGPSARRLAGVWNNLFASSDSSGMDLTPALHASDHHDAFIAPDLPPVDELDALSVEPSIRPGYYQTSEYMTGSVAVGIVLLESDGRVDPSTENWTSDEKQLVFSKIVAALNWWVQLEPRANLSFIYDEHCFEPLPTGVEPITRPYADQRYWIADAMGTLGYNASSYFTRVRDYNNSLREIYQTDWAFTIFVVDSSADRDNCFDGGYFAYAYLGGPFLVMTYGNNGYGSQHMDATAAHEVGHIFYALDQYYGACQPCTRRSGYLYVENQNSQYGSCLSNENSIMRSLIYPFVMGAIDPYAAGQIGWRDSDGDNILDPLDTELPLSIDLVTRDGSEVTVSGTAQIVPYPSASPYHTSVTTNRLVGVQYRFGGGDWAWASAVDGCFDSTTEPYHLTANLLSPGLYILEVAAVDSAGNLSEPYATQTIVIPDPTDNGLNTELLVPGNDLFSDQSLAIEGIAYHLKSGTVAQVEYRIDGSLWQPAIAQDGDFDSDYETFTIELEPLMAGAYLIEAFAVDADGQVEINIASEKVLVRDRWPSTLFLPVVMGGM